VEACKNISSADNLNKVGYEYLAETTEYLKNSNLYKDADKEILVQYALSVQNYYKYLHKRYRSYHAASILQSNATPRKTNVSLYG
jgi:hypothetical protein